MTYIPPDAEWYVADIVEEICVDGDSRNIVHKNLVLIHAISPQEAYEKALTLGRRRETTYQNPDDKQVRTIFRGLSDLNVIYDELQHGTEILYEEKIGVTDEEIEQWILPKEQLNVFRPIKRLDAPDYSSKEIVADARERKPTSS